jgi:UDP-N-acetylmuramate--alanine ligase
MIKKQKISTVYLLGIGGIGMSALARYYRQQGKEVSGYDKTRTSLTRQLEQEGMNIHYRDDPAYIPCDANLVIYTPAIPDSNRELSYCREVDFNIKKRAEVLGMIAEDYETIAVAGTHGKTTISSMITHIMQHAKFPVTAFIGGIMSNYDTNFINNENSRFLIAEADEYDRSFHMLHPKIAVISTLAADHLDIYGSVEQLRESFTKFVSQIKPVGWLIIHEDAAKQIPAPAEAIIYGKSQDADLRISNADVSEHNYYFDLHQKSNEKTRITMQVPGQHNIENAVAAAAVCIQAGLSMKEIKRGLETYKGVKRRFEFIIQEEDLVFINDYAHHPEEITACISTARAIYPGKKITAVFQAHLYSRTRDLADEFAASLDLFDEVVLLDIYPAREAPIEGVNAELLLSKMNISNKRISTKEDLPDVIKKLKPEVLITMGAGDIEQLVLPIKQALKS